MKEAEEVENSTLTQKTPSTQVLTEGISQAIKTAESNLQEIEYGLNDSIEKDEQHLKASLQKQLEIKDNLLNCKDSQIIDQQDRINKLEEEKDALSKTLNNKKNLQRPNNAL